MNTKLDSPSKRAGAIALVFGLAIIVYTAGNWHFTNTPFARHVEGFGAPVGVPRPAPVEGGTWHHSIRGWTLYENKCFAENEYPPPKRSTPGLITRDIPDRPEHLQKCAIDFVSHHFPWVDEWQFSFDQYVSALFRDGRHGYFWFSVFGFPLAAIGIFLITGLFDSIRQWVYHGSTDS